MGGVVGATIGGMMGSRLDGSTTETVKAQVKVSCSVPICQACLAQVTKKHALAGIVSGKGDFARDVASNQFLSGEIEEGYLLLTFASVACAEAFREANKEHVLELDAAQRLFRPKRLPRGRPASPPDHRPGVDARAEG